MRVDLNLNRDLKNAEPGTTLLAESVVYSMDHNIAEARLRHGDTRTCLYQASEVPRLRSTA